MHTSCCATGSAQRHHPLLDTQGHGLYSRDGASSLYLPPHPYRLLAYLAEQPPGRVVPYDELQRAVFLADEVVPTEADDRLRYHLRILRQIATYYGGWPANMIVTRVGVGVHLNIRVFG